MRPQDDQAAWAGTLALATAAIVAMLGAALALTLSAPRLASVTVTPIVVPEPAFPAVLRPALVEAPPPLPLPARLLAWALADPAAPPAPSSGEGSPTADAASATETLPPRGPAAPEPVSEGLPADFYLPVVSAGPATDLETRFLAAANEDRVAAGLPPLAYDPGLSQIARTRSQQMADQGYFGHVDPHGYRMYVELLARAGYGYAWAGENLAVNNFALDRSPEAAVAALMASDAHRDNLLASDFDRAGVGEVTTADGRHIYTIVFLG